MKTIVCTKYGPTEVLQLQDVEKLVPRDDNEVLMKVHAATATASALGGRKGDPFLSKFPWASQSPRKTYLDRS